MVVVSLAVNVGFDAPCKVLNADGIRLHGLFAPVPRSGLAHEIHRDQCVYNTVLNEVKVLSRHFPRLTIFFLKCGFELVIAAFLRQTALQIGNLRDRSAKALHLVEDLEEYIDDGILILLSRRLALGINVEQNDIGRGLGGQLHIGKYHRVDDLFIVDEVVKRLFAAHLTVLQKVGEYFQKVRFTASKETGNPNAHFWGSPHNALLIRSVEIGKMLLQLAGDNIFFKFLRDIGILALSDNYNALNLSIDFLGKHFFDLHCTTSITSQA